VWDDTVSVSADAMPGYLLDLREIQGGEHAREVPSYSSGLWCYRITGDGCLHNGYEDHNFQIMSITTSWVFCMSCCRAETDYFGTSKSKLHVNSLPYKHCYSRPADTGENHAQI
jgi:hypothetical protein